MESVTFGGQLTEREFTRMQLLAMPWWGRYFGWLLLAAGVMALASGGYRAVAENPVREGAKFITPLAFTVFAFALPRISIRRQWRANPSVRGHISGRVDQEGVEWKGPFVQGRFPWEALLRYRRAEGLVVVYTAPQSILYFPRSFFDDAEQWDAFVTLVSQKIRA